MPLFTIQNSNETVPHGNYNATFNGIDDIETERGKAIRWRFTIADGEYKNRPVSYLSDAEYPPSPNNKTGRYLAALSNKSLTSGLSVNTDDYVGQRYLLIVRAVGDKTKLETFSKL